MVLFEMAIINNCISMADEIVRRTRTSADLLLNRLMAFVLTGEGLPITLTLPNDNILAMPYEIKNKEKIINMKRNIGEGVDPSKSYNKNNVLTEDDTLCLFYLIEKRDVTDCSAFCCRIDFLSDNLYYKLIFADKDGDIRYYTCRIPNPSHMFWKRQVNGI